MSAQEAASRRLALETRQLYATLLSSSRLPDERQFARPQFKLIYELAKSLASETNALRGVFSANDFDPQRKWDRRSREQFVQRLVEFVSLNKRPVVGLVAAKVVAGAEPTKSNELLQSVAKIVAAKCSSASSSVSAVAAAGGRPRTATKQQQQVRSRPSSKVASPERRSANRRVQRPASNATGNSPEKSGNLTPASEPASLSPKIRTSRVQPLARPPEVDSEQQQEQSAESPLDFKTIATRSHTFSLGNVGFDLAANLLSVRSNLKALCCTLDTLVGVEESLKTKLEAELAVE